MKYIFLNFTSHFDFELNYLIHYLIIWLLSYSFIQLLFSSTFSNSIFNEIKPKLNHVYLLQISPPNRFAYVKLSALKPAACYISDCLNENIYPVSSEQVFNISKYSSHVHILFINQLMNLFSTNSVSCQPLWNKNHE